MSCLACLHPLPFQSCTTSPVSCPSAIWIVILRQREEKFHPQLKLAWEIFTYLSFILDCGNGYRVRYRIRNCESHTSSSEPDALACRELAVRLQVQETYDGIRILV